MYGYEKYSSIQLGAMTIHPCTVCICLVAKDIHPGALTYWGAWPCNGGEHHWHEYTSCNSVDTCAGASLHQ